MDTTTLLLKRVMERKLPATLRLRRREPKSHQVTCTDKTTALVHGTRRVVLIGSTRMEDMRVAHKLDITGRKDHVKRQLGTGLLPSLQGVILLLRQRGNFGVRTGVVPRQRGKVVRIELGINARVGAGTLVLQVQDRPPDPLLLSFRDLALAVKVPIRGGHGFDHVRMSFLKNIKHMVCRRDIGFATNLGFGNAQKTDDVGSISMEVLTGEAISCV